MNWRELNQADVTFESLRETGYNEEVLNAVKNESFESLRGNEFLKDIEAAKFILYACVNARVEMNYSIYAYLQEDVKRGLLSETDISNNILQTAPEVIEDSPLARDESAILANVNNKPEIVKYMSEDLASNPTFVSELADKNPEVVKEMLEKYPVEKLIATNPELATNPAFMAEAIARDVTVIRFASEEIKNNYDVFAKAAKENEQVADYILQNVGYFGNDAIKGAKDGTTESIREDTVDILKEASEKYRGYEKLTKQMKGQESLERDGKTEYKLRSNVQIYAKSRVSGVRAGEEDLNKIFNSIELTMEELRRELKENPGMLISQTSYGALPKPEEVKEMIEKSKVEDKEMYAERLAKYEKFRDTVKKFVSKEKEPKEKREVARETQEERDEELSPEAKHFNSARESIEKKEKLWTPGLLKRLLEKSELKDDKETIAWLEQYTKYYEEMQEKASVKNSEHNAELSVSAITLIVNDKGIKKIITYDHTMPDGLQLTPEQMHQLESDLADRNVQRENVQVIETPKRGIRELQAQKDEAKTGPGM